MAMQTGAGDGVRLDKWLWAARFFKTRGIAAEAIAGGKVELNGARPKRSKEVRPGDKLRIRQGVYEHHVVIQALSERRGPAAAAAALYEESTASRRAREELATRLKAERDLFTPAKGRPTKRDRRQMERLKGERREE